MGIIVLMSKWRFHHLSFPSLSNYSSDICFSGLVNSVFFSGSVVENG